MKISGSLSSLGLLVLALSAGNGHALWAQKQKPGVLLGIVGDTTGKPLADAEVVALRSKRLVKTDARGIFTLSLPAGDETLIVRRIGFVPQTFGASMTAGDSTRVGVVLAAAPPGATALPDLVVEAEGVSYGGKMSGFGDRMLRAGVPRSQFLTRKDIEASGLSLAVDLLTRTGLSLRADLSPESRMKSKRSKLICPRGTTSFRLIPRTAYYLDGARMNDDFDVNSIDISQIEAIEVYHSAAQMPVQYNSLGYGCVVLMWLRGVGN